MTIGSNGNGHWHEAAPDRPDEAEGLSGRRFLIVAGVVFFTLWGLLFAGFRAWRARYRARAAFGMSRVLPAIDQLWYLDINNINISEDQWHDAVDRTHAMLETVVAANLLDLDQMEALGAELKARVARAKEHPETAPAELAAVWDSMADRAEFLLTEKDRHPRPKILPPRKSKIR